MQPVRVKVYGLVSLTRKRYLILQGFGLVLLAALMAIWVVMPRPNENWRAGGIDPWLFLVARVLDLIPWIVLLLFVAGAVETWIVLGRFRRQEELQRATSLGEEQAPAS